MSLQKNKMIFVTVLYMIVWFNGCSHALTGHPLSIKPASSFCSYGCRTPFLTSTYDTSWNTFNKRTLFQSLSMPSSVSDNSNKSRLTFPLLERSHEKVVATLFGSLSAALLYYAGTFSSIDGLSPMKPGKWLVVAETSLALTWSSMIIAISFLEAWTKFRAPFLKKYIAVDVGRHVFATLNAAELGIISSFWLHRVFQCYQVQKILGGALLYKGRAYYQQFTFSLPATATLLLLIQAVIIAPKLYVRAKRRILEGFDEALPSVKISMTKSEQAALADISRDLRRIRKIPSRVWHSLYAIAEMVKVGCLNAFVILSWLKLLS